MCQRLKAAAASAILLLAIAGCVPEYPHELGSLPNPQSTEDMTVSAY